MKTEANYGHSAKEGNVCIDFNQFKILKIKEIKFSTDKFYHFNTGLKS